MKTITLFLITGLIAGCSKNQNTIGNDTDSISFKLDFSEQKTIVYDYKQEMIQSGSVVESMEMNNVLMKANSRVNWMIVDTSKATLKILNVKSTMLRRDASNKVIDSMSSQLGDLTISDINYYGRVKDQSQQTLISGFFVLPDNPIRMGESDTLEASIVSNTNGIGTNVPGITIVKYIKNEKKSGRNCAVLSIESKMTMDQVTNNTTFDMVSNGICYFDLENRIIVSGTSTATMAQKMEVPSIVSGNSTSGFPEEVSLKVSTKITFELVED